MPKFTWNVDPIAFEIGSFQMRWYSLIFTLMFFGGYLLLAWHIRRGGGEWDEGAEFIPYGVIGSIVGARVGHALFYEPHKLAADPLWLLRVWEGGLASHGAVVGVGIGMWLFCKRRNISFIEGADRSTYAGTLSATMVRVGNFFNSEIVGRPTDQTWGVQFLRYPENPHLYRYPTQLFEAGMGVFIMAALFVFDSAIGKERRPRGAMIAFWFTLYFALRFIVEFFKEQQVYRGATLDMGQYLSIPGFLLGLFGLYWAFKKRVPAGWYEEYPEEKEEEKPRRRSIQRDPDVDAEFGAGKKRKGAKRKKKKAKKATPDAPEPGTAPEAASGSAGAATAPESQPEAPPVPESAGTPDSESERPAK